MSSQKASDKPATVPPSRAARWGALIVGVAFAAVVMARFYARTWWPPDDGIYAYVAQRMLAGDRLNGEIQDIHTGLLHFIHAAAMWMFGEDIRSLRYPLAALTVLQAGMGCVLLWRRSALLGLTAAVGTAALTFVQFINPSANWYALVVAVAAMLLLAHQPGDPTWRNVAVGFLIAVAFALRQLSGVCLAIGALGWLLAENRGAPARGATLARLLIATMLAGVVLYMALLVKWSGIVLVGIWPVLILAMALRRSAVGAADTVRLLLQLVVGAVPVVVPLVGYHVLNGTLQSWFDDVFVVALSLPKLSFIEQPSLFVVAATALAAIIRAGSVHEAVSGVFWLILVVLPIALGIGILVRCRRGDRSAPWQAPPLVASCFALVSAHYETQIYLLHSTGAVLLGWLWLQSDAHAGRRRRAMAFAVVGFLAVVGLVLQAGQPVQRGFVATMRGIVQPLDAPNGIPGAHVAMSAADRDLYTSLIAFVRAHARSCDTVLALPMDPEINFLSGRRAPFRFFSSSLGLRSDEDIRRAEEILERAPPAVVVWLPDDKYNTPRTLILMNWIRERYVPAGQAGPFRLFLPPPSAVPRAPCP